MDNTSNSNLLKKQALEQGKIKLKVKHSGMVQQFEFLLIYEDTNIGKVPFLKISRPVDASELLRVAQEVDLPILALSGKYFPPKKGMKDFVLN